jgi:predicted Zn-dependent protease
MNAAVNGHGRGQESEADEVGLGYLVNARYDPREAPRTFEQLLEEDSDQAPLTNFFYGNHPTNVVRIERTTALAQSKYAGQVANGRLIVNTQEYVQRTREVVIAFGRLDYVQKRFTRATAMFQKAARPATATRYRIATWARSPSKPAALRASIAPSLTSPLRRESIPDMHPSTASSG